MMSNKFLFYRFAKLYFTIQFCTHLYRTNQKISILILCLYCLKYFLTICVLCLEALYDYFLGNYLKMCCLLNSMIQALNNITDPKNHKIFNLINCYLKNKEQACIGITGAGGAGKTTLAINLVNYFGSVNALAIDLDDYLISREERGRLGLVGYQPEANNLNLARKQILKLKKYIEIKKPVYDHSTGRNERFEIISPKPIMIFEGVITLYDELDDLYDLSIFLDALEETQIKSRIERDVNKRGYTVDEALELYKKLKPHYVKYIEPTKKKADIVGVVGVDYVIHIKV